MSEESPPSYTTSVFNQANFTQVSSVDTEYLNENYVKYPITQTGTITIANLAITNDATVNGLTVGRGNNSVSTSTAVGVSTLGSSTGINNTALGYQAGFAGTANITGTNNTYLGYQAQANGNAYTNSTALGASAIITASNNIVLGTTSETIKYNKASPLYSTIPTFATNDIGYFLTDTSSTTAITTTVTTFATVAIPVAGVWLINAQARVSGSSAAQTIAIMIYNGSGTKVSETRPASTAASTPSSISGTTTFIHSGTAQSFTLRVNTSTGTATLDSTTTVTFIQALRIA